MFFVEKHSPEMNLKRGGDVLLFVDTLPGGVPKTLLGKLQSTVKWGKYHQ